MGMKRLVFPAFAEGQADPKVLLREILGSKPQGSFNLEEMEIRQTILDKIDEGGPHVDLEDAHFELAHNAIKTFPYQVVNKMALKLKQAFETGASTKINPNARPAAPA